MATEYITVLGKITKERKWGLMALLAGKDPAASEEILTTLFLDATADHDDQAAAEFLRLVFHALEDIEIMPLTQLDGKKTVISDFRSEQEARERASSQRATKAMALWPRIPEVQLRPGRFHGDEPERHSTLQETKRHLVIEIATRWLAAKDAEEADILFGYLTRLPSRNNFDVTEMVRKALREVAARARPDRLITSYLKLAQSPARMYDREEILRILAMNWGRQGETEATLQQFKVIAPLMGSSRVAHELVAEFAWKVADVDRAAQDLTTILGEKQYRMGMPPRPEGYEYTPGKLTYGFLPSNPRPSIMAHLRVPVGWHDAFDEERGHQIFDTARRNIKLWQQTQPYDIFFSVGVYRANEETELWRRELMIIKV
jgi:hypothetical protein